ncbi:MAG TPA: VOC family protein [Thermoanaerobaculia bacterium]|nr:VOC family protein [Thermoanaerobaculia bacterium]
MSERNAIELLDEAVDAILADRTPHDVGPEVALLAALAVDLRDLPDPAFKARLRKELVPEEQTMIPYFVVSGADRLISFITEAFGGELVARYPRPDGSVMHAEMRIGDSKVEIGEPSEIMELHPAAIHLYVGNVDELYERALAAGAVSLHPLTNQPYGDREGSVRDPLGNHWYIATHLATGSKPSPEFRSVTPFLHARGADRLIDWMQRALSAQLVDRSASPEGTVQHAILRIGTSVIEMGEAHGEWQPMPMHIHVYVSDADAVYQQAIEAGGTVSYPINDAPYGERVGGVTDPAGNTWYIATKLA